MSDAPKQENILLRKLARPIAEYFWPSITSTIDEALNFVQQHSEYKLAITFINVQNIAAVMLTNGEDKATKALNGLKDFIFENCCEPKLVLRNGLERIVVIMRCDDINQHKVMTDVLIAKISAFGASILGNPTCFALKLGSSSIENFSQENFYTCLDEAFMALYEAKQSEAVNHYFYTDIQKSIAEYQKELTLATKFQALIQSHNLRMAYQAVVDAKTGKIKSYEALLRFVDDNGNISSAGYMIPVAEKYGFINQVDFFVLHEAVAQLKANDQLSISINVSNLSVHTKEWLDIATALLKDNEELASRLIVELTETGVQRNLDVIAKFVESVKILGCKVALDDFGAGYSSFSQLKILDIDYVKIDGAFIRDIQDNPDSKLFVKTLQQFASAFGIKTIAEFVENGNVAKTLIDLEVDYLQGYYFGKPINHRPWINED